MKNIWIKLDKCPLCGTHMNCDSEELLVLLQAVSNAGKLMCASCDREVTEQQKILSNQH
jgi:hypothetical protein